MKDYHKQIIIIAVLAIVAICLSILSIGLMISNQLAHALDTYSQMLQKEIVAIKENDQQYIDSSVSDAVNNIKLPKGEKGDTGNTGATGQTGATGAKGDKGDTGNDGKDGVNGTAQVIVQQGEKGDKGDKGDPGEDGKSIATYCNPNFNVLMSSFDMKSWKFVLNDNGTPVNCNLENA